MLTSMLSDVFGLVGTTVDHKYRVVIGLVGLVGMVGLLSCSQSTSEAALPTTVEPAPQPTVEPAPKPTPPPVAAPSGFVRIEPGTFSMGSPESEKGRVFDETQHRVTLTRAYYMKATEVTQGEWEALMGSNPSSFKACGASCPVDNVSWYDAIAYANALSKKDGLERCYQDGDKDYDADSASLERTPSWPKGVSCLGYRLPTEAEWEYAARAGTTTAFSTGEITEPEGQDPNLDKAGWYSDNSGGKTHPVGGKQANALGFYDMHGNVLEWVWDWKEEYGSGDRRDPLGPQTGSIRVLRGGSWYDGARFCRSALRNGSVPFGRDSFLGFRLSRSIP